MLKRIALFSLLFLMILFFSWQTLMTYTVKYAVQTYFENKFATTVAFDSIINENGYWIIERPSFTGKIVGSAEQLIVGYEWEILKRILHLDVEIIRPHATLSGTNSEEAMLQSNSSFFSIPLNPISLQLALSIDNGGLKFPGMDEEISVQFEGQWHSKGKGYCIALLQAGSPSISRVAINLNESKQGKAIKLDMNNADCIFFENALKNFFSFHGWHVLEGNVTGQLDMQFDNNKSPIIVGNLIVENLAFSHNEKHLFGIIPAAFLSFKNSNELYGKCEFMQPAFFTFGAKNSSWNLHDLSGGLLFTDKTIEMDFNALCNHFTQDYPVHIKGKADFFHGNIDFDFQLPSHGKEPSSAHLTAMQVEQGVYEANLSLKHVFPAHEQVFISSLVFPSNETTNVEGELSFFDSEQSRHLSLPFGLTLINSPSNENKQFLLQILSLCGYQISNGWFEGHSISINNELLPFYDVGAQFKGVINLFGSYDQNSLTVHYGIHHLNVENDYLKIEIPDLIAESPFNAVYYFDFQTEEQGGFIELTDATYLEKNAHLEFTNMQGQLSIGTNSIHVANVETFCHDVYLAGEIDVDFKRELKETEIGIRAQNINGKASNALKILKEILRKDISLKFPLEGDLSLRNEGANLNLNLTKKGTETSFEIHGSLSEGNIKSQKEHKIALSELNFNFDYNLLGNQLLISDLQGTVLLGTSEKIEEYALAGDRINLKDWTKGIFEFDLWMGDKNRDIIRLAGETFSNKQGNIEFYFEPLLSHIGTVHPKVFQLAISKDLSRIEFLKGEFEFQIETLFHDFQKMTRTNFLPIPESLLHELNKPKHVEGFSQVAFLYDNQTTDLSYNVSIENLIVDQNHFKKVVLDGSKKDKIWKINQVQFDDISLAAECFFENDIWNISFLGLKFGKGLLMGLEGKYSFSEKLLDAKVKLLEIDLKELSEWPQIKDTISKYTPYGDLRASGNIRAKLTNGKPRWRIEAEMSAAIKNGGVCGISFNDINSMALQYKSDEGITLKNIETAIRSPSGKLLDFQISKLDFLFKAKELRVNHINFSIPNNQLPKVIDFLQDKWKELSFLDPIKSLKSSALLKGTLDISISPHLQNVKLVLPAGQYEFQNWEHSIHSFALDWTPFSLNIDTEYLFHGKPLWLTLRAKPDLLDGELLIYPSSPKKQHHQPITLFWENNSNGFAIQKIICQNPGLKIHLTKENNQSFDLKGEIAIDPKVAAEYLQSEWKERLTQWQINGLFSLHGIWKLKDLAHWAEGLKFEGKLIGKECGCNGYLFDSLLADILYDSQFIHAKEVRVEDPAGIAFTDQLTIQVKANDCWDLSIPYLKISHLRPNLLKRIDNSNLIQEDGTFIIKKLEIEEFKGNICDSKSYTGKGKAECFNLPKQETHHPIWNIPSDILSTLGLDLAALNPVSGKVHFSISDRRIYLTKLKDTYSAGHLSKFYLPKKPSHPSFLDFDGNLFVQIKMRQYNILFKLAELFTVTIQGTWNNPTYSILPQSYKEAAGS